jgi:hypothetical protein
MFYFDEKLYEKIKKSQECKGMVFKLKKTRLAHKYLLKFVDSLKIIKSLSCKRDGKCKSCKAINLRDILEIIDLGEELKHGKRYRLVIVEKVKGIDDAIIGFKVGFEKYRKNAKEKQDAKS